VLLARLAEQWPDTYAGMKPAALTVALRHYGVETRQVWALSTDGEARNRRGVVRDDVAAAVAERDDTD
jgi:S-DNA-T family DNA segregation ATPase FtsK/SpoIIIE